MNWLHEWTFSGLRLSLPLIFAAFGGLLSERSGVANIALEAYLLASSFAAAATMSLSHSIPLSVGAGLFMSALVGGFFCFLHSLCPGRSNYSWYGDQYFNGKPSPRFL